MIVKPPKVGIRSLSQMLMDSRDKWDVAMCVGLGNQLPGEKEREKRSCSSSLPPLCTPRAGISANTVSALANESARPVLCQYQDDTRDLDRSLPEAPYITRYDLRPGP